MMHGWEKARQSFGFLGFPANRFARARIDSLQVGHPTPPSETPVSGAGDKAVFDQDATPTNGLKTENLAVLKGNAVLVLSVTLDQKRAFVAKEKLTDFAIKQLVPRM